MKKMKKTIELISVVAIAMALMIAFSGVALASPPVPPTKETERVEITTDITCSGTVVESQRLSLESKGLVLGITLPEIKKAYMWSASGKIGYDEKMIGSSGNTNFCKEFKVDTGTAPNLAVHKQIGYTQGFLGSLSHHEQAGMKVIAAGKKTTTKKGSDKHEPWKQAICPFKEETNINTPSSCEEVHVYSEVVMTDVEATTETEMGITDAPVSLSYKIKADGTGFVAAGVDVYVVDGRRGDTLGSRMAYKGKSNAYGNFSFVKDVGYKSVITP